MTKIEAENICLALDNYAVQINWSDWNDFTAIATGTSPLWQDTWALLAINTVQQGVVRLAEMTIYCTENVEETVWVIDSNAWSPEIAFADIPRLLEQKAFW